MRNEAAKLLYTIGRCPRYVCVVFVATSKRVRKVVIFVRFQYDFAETNLTE